MVRKSTKHTVKIIKIVIKTILPVVVMTFFCWICLYSNSYVDSTNTYQVDIQVKSIIFDNPHKGRSTGIITATDGGTYEIYSRFLDDGEVNGLLNSKEEIHLTVWDYHFVLGPAVKNIVDMRSEDTVYHSIDEHNEYSKEQRTGYYCSVIPIFFVFGLFLSGIFFFVDFLPEIKNILKRKRSKKLSVNKKQRGRNER